MFTLHGAGVGVYGTRACDQRSGLVEGRKDAAGLQMMFNLEILPGAYVICRLNPEEPIPKWLRGELVSVTRTSEELSVVCSAEGVPHDVQRESGWRCLRVIGKLDFSLVGVIARITTVLADEGLSVLTLSTFNTDYFLVRETDLQRAVHALRNAGMKTESASTVGTSHHLE